VGEDPKKYINEYSNEFMKDFIHLLKTGHGEKSVHINKVKHTRLMFFVKRARC
jgi:DNA/RNA-binding protein KIN17